MIIVNNEMLGLWKSFVASELRIAQDKLAIDFRAVFVGQSSSMGVLSTSPTTVLSTDTGVCFATYAAASDSYIFGGNDEDYYLYLGHLGNSLDLIVDDTYNLTIQGDTTLNGFFFKDIKVKGGDLPTKIYVLRFRRLAS